MPERFVSESNKLAAQFDTYEGVPGTHIDGQLTLGENIADLAASVAWTPTSVAGRREAPAVDGLTGDQRLSWLRAGVARQGARQCGEGADGLGPALAAAIPRDLDQRETSTTGTKFLDVIAGPEYYLKEEDRVHVW